VSGTFSCFDPVIKGRVENLFSEVFAKKIGFKEFQQVNKNFEYRIIFDASLQRRQQELCERYD
jgi:hypothetical protein